MSQVISKNGGQFLSSPQFTLSVVLVADSLLAGRIDSAMCWIRTHYLCVMSLHASPLH